MKQRDVAAESLLKYNPILNISCRVIAINAYLVYNIYMNVFEIRNLQNSLKTEKKKKKNFFKIFIKSVETGANGTLDYIVKKGSGKNKIAKTRQ